MGKATAVEVSEIPVSRRGRSVQIDTEMVEDLKAILDGNVSAYNLSGYFPGKDLSDTKVKQAIGQNIRKHWTNSSGLCADGKALRLDFSDTGIFARLSGHATPATKTGKAKVSK